VCPPRTGWHGAAEPLDTVPCHDKRFLESDAADVRHVDSRFIAAHHPLDETLVHFGLSWPADPAGGPCVAGRPMGIFVLVTSDPVDYHCAEVVREPVP